MGARAKPERDRFRITGVRTSIDAAVLVLPGGKPVSTAASRPWQLANVRVNLLAGALRRRLGPRVEVRLVRYRLRGWNADRLDAVTDAQRALAELRDRLPAERLVVVGHSMGGRVAAHLARDVGAVAALAPWWPQGDADLIPAGRRLLVMHGSADTWTDPVAARSQTDRARSRGVDAHWVPVPGAGHFMLRPYALWHRTVADFVLAGLAFRP